MGIFDSDRIHDTKVTREIKPDVLITLDRVYLNWIELLHKCKKHIWDRDKMTFGDYCQQLKDLGFKII